MSMDQLNQHPTPGTPPQAADDLPPITGLGMGGAPYESQEPTPAKPPSKTLIIVAAAGLLLAGFGIVRAIIAGPKPKTPQQRVESIWSEQVRMGQEALDLAEEVQQIHNDHADVLDELHEAAEQLGQVEDDIDQ